MSDHDGYFLYHSIGQYPDKAERMSASLDAFSAQWSAGGDGQWPYADGIERRFLDLWRQVLNAPTGCIATAESVTSAVHALLTALPEKTLAGKRVVIGEDSFPSLLFLLSGMASRIGYTLDIVPIRDNGHWVECDDIAAQIDDSAGLVMLNWISSTSSHKCNAPRLAKLAREAGAIVGIDLTQGAGILPFDVNDVPVDFAATTSLKWICGTPGAGILYVRPDLIGVCVPERRGWFSQANPFNWSLSDFAFADDARKFHLGTPSILGCVGTVPALEWLLAGGLEENRKNNVRLVTGILELADELGFTLCSPPEDYRRGASVMLELPGNTDPKAALKLLKENQVYADARGRVLRLSPGVLTTESGLDRLRQSLHKLAG